MFRGSTPVYQENCPVSPNKSMHLGPYPLDIGSGMTLSGEVYAVLRDNFPILHMKSIP